MLKMIVKILVALVIIALILRFIPITVEQKPAPEKQRQVACLQDGETSPDPAKPLARCATLEKINQDYLARIKPIAEKKCLMCHAQPKELPLYAVIPPMKWLIDHDIKEGIEDMDMRYDFPFRENAASKKHRGSLHEFKEVIQKNNMPPLAYKIMHWQSGLTESENKTILDWVEKSKAMLKAEEETVVSATTEVPPQQ